MPQYPTPPNVDRPLHVAAGVAFVAVAVASAALSTYRGVAHRPAADVDVVRNGSAELGRSGATPIGWRSRHIVARSFSIPVGAEMGRHFFFGGAVAREPASAAAAQVVSLGRYADLIDSGNAEATLEARLSGIANQRDSAYIIVRFARSRAGLRRGPILGSLKVGPVSPKQRSFTVIFLDAVDAGTIPAGSRVASVTLRERSWDGPVNDAYADLISLRISPP
jgi:hypothetical protein